MKNSINQKWEIICKSMNEFDIEYHKLANLYNLSDSSFWILYDLYENEDGCTQKEFYTEWSLNKQTINSSVKYLINKGYVALECLDDNKKSKKLRLTEKGREMSKNTVGKVMELEEKAFGNIDENEMNMVINFFEKQLESFKNQVDEIIKNEEDKNK